MLYIERDDDFKAREARAREILRRLKSCHHVKATAAAVNPAAVPARNGYTAGAGEPMPRQDWMADVSNALTRGAGRVGTKLLVAALTRQSKSQACGFRTIAMETKMAESDAEFLYLIALGGFLFWMDRLKIPDDYRPIAEMPAVSYRRATQAAA